MGVWLPSPTEMKTTSWRTGSPSSSSTPQPAGSFTPQYVSWRETAVRRVSQTGFRDHRPAAFLGPGPSSKQRNLVLHHGLDRVPQFEDRRHGGGPTCSHASSQQDLSNRVQATQILKKMTIAQVDPRPRGKQRRALSGKATRVPLWTAGNACNNTLPRPPWAWSRWKGPWQCSRPARDYVIGATRGFYSDAVASGYAAYQAPPTFPRPSAWGLYLNYCPQPLQRPHSMQMSSLARVCSCSHQLPHVPRQRITSGNHGMCAHPLFLSLPAALCPGPHGRPHAQTDGPAVSALMVAAWCSPPSSAHDALRTPSLNLRI